MKWHYMVLPLEAINERGYTDTPGSDSVVLVKIAIFGSSGFPFLWSKAHCKFPHNIYLSRGGVWKVSYSQGDLLLPCD